MSLDTMSKEKAAEILEKSQSILDQLKLSMVSDIKQKRLSGTTDLVSDALEIARVYASAAASFIHYVRKMHKLAGREMFLAQVGETESNNKTKVKS